MTEPDLGRAFDVELPNLTQCCSSWRDRAFQAAKDEALARRSQLWAEAETLKALDELAVLRSRERTSLMRRERDILVAEIDADRHVFLTGPMDLCKRPDCGEPASANVHRIAAVILAGARLVAMLPSSAVTWAAPDAHPRF